MTVSSSRTGSRNIPDTVAQLRATFRSGRTKPIEWRLAQLVAIEAMLVEQEARFTAALTADLGRPPFDGWLADLAPVVAEARHAARELRSWMRPRKVRTPVRLWPASSWYQYEPLGVTLIIGPWNYPVHLVLAPLVGAIAAGNCAVLKPSEQTPACSALLAELVPQYLDRESVAVVEGAAEATTELLDQAVDHCLFTGSSAVGKIVMAAAAKHLTPVTLELGGKSPVIVAADARLDVAARRIVFGKLLNSGQTCVAPDHVLVERAVGERFVVALNDAIAELAGDRDLPLVNRRHAARLAEMIDTAGGRTVVGGRLDVERHRGRLTVIVDPDPDSDVMRQEIFGPVLPVVTVDSLDDAIAHVQQGPKPLALYLFTESRATEARVLSEVSSGGALVNHVVQHLLVNELPFGGVGDSGTGAYHGRWGFETFSHRRAVMRKPTRPDPSIAYPPFTRVRQLVLRRLF